MPWPARPTEFVGKKSPQWAAEEKRAQEEIDGAFAKFMESKEDQRELERSDTGSRVRWRFRGVACEPGGARLEACMAMRRLEATASAAEVTLVSAFSSAAKADSDEINSDARLKACSTPSAGYSNFGTALRYRPDHA